MLKIFCIIAVRIIFYLTYFFMNTKKFFKGAVFGVIAGTIGAYLFNPTTGKKNRDKMKKSAQKVMQKLAEEMSKLPNITKREYNTVVKKVIDDVKEDGSMSDESWKMVKKELDSRWTDVKNQLNKKMKK